MKRSTHWLVADHGILPIGPSDRCFFCNTEMGKEHREGCAVRRRTVVVRFHVEMVVGVPEDWDTDMVHFKFNSGSWCGDNVATEVADAVERTNKAGGCMCPFVTAEFVREATEKDEQAQGLRVNELPS